MGKSCSFGISPIRPVQSNNPRDSVNMLSLIARLRTIALQHPHPSSLKEYFNGRTSSSWSCYMKVTNGSYRKVCRVWINLYRYILYQILDVTTLKTFTRHKRNCNPNLDFGQLVYYILGINI